MNGRRKRLRVVVPTPKTMAHMLILAHCCLVIVKAEAPKKDLGSPSSNLNNGIYSSNFKDSEVEGFRISTRKSSNTGDESLYLDKSLIADDDDYTQVDTNMRRKNRIPTIPPIPPSILKTKAKAEKRLKENSDMLDKKLKAIIPRIRGLVIENSGQSKEPENIRSKIEKRISRGRVTMDFGCGDIHFNKSGTSMADNSYPKHNFGGNNRTNGKIRVSMDPNAFGRLISIIFATTSSFVFAFLGTLRLLTPLIVSKRILRSLYNVLADWYTGRYFRKTYSRLEKIYIHYYETPASFRALSRTLSQWMVYLVLYRIMGFLVRSYSPPCRSEGRGLAFLCGLLMVGTVYSSGHAFARAVALWGGPLRLQAAAHPTRTYIFNIIHRPWIILRWMQNPEQFMALISLPEKRPFNPNPVLFPATWPPLRFLQMAAVARVASTEPTNYMWCSKEVDQIPNLMSKYFLQLALNDEYCRVFIGEKRIGLGLAISSAYFLAMLSFLMTSAKINAKVTLLMIPSLIASIVSGWMNTVVYINRFQKNRNEKNMILPFDQSSSLGNGWYPQN